MFIKLHKDSYIRLDNIARFTFYEGDLENYIEPRVIITTTSFTSIEINKDAVDLYERLRKAFNIVE